MDEPKLEVRTTKRYDGGVFTKEQLKQGEKLVVFGGYVLHVSEEVGDYGL